MTGDIIKSFLVGLGFDVDSSSLIKFNKAIESASVKIAALYTAIQVATIGIFAGIAKMAEGFENIGYELRLVAPAINKMLILRQAMLSAYSAAGIDLVKVVQQSILFNLSLAKTKIALEAVYKSVGAKFLPMLTKQMDIFRGKIFANMPKIQETLEKFVSFIFKAFDATIQLGHRVWDILGRVWDFFKMLDTATDGWSTKILLAVAAWKFLNLSFLATPLGMLLTGFLALLTLWDDFKTFQEGGKSLINWGSDATKMVVGITAVIGGLGAAVLAIVGIMRTWAAVQWLVNAAMTANPIGLVIVGVTALIALITTLAYKFGYLKSVSGFFEGIGDKAINFFGGANPVSPGGAPGAAQSIQNIQQPPPLLPQGGGVHQRVSQETNINVTGSADANAVGKAVAGEQNRVNSDLTRNFKPRAQ